MHILYAFFQIKHNTKYRSLKQQIDTIALLGWQLAQLRRSNIINKQRPKEDPKQFFKIRPPKKVTQF